MRAWREWGKGKGASKSQSEIGQLLLYLLGAHARRLQKQKDRRPKPILGVFMDGDKVLPT